MRKSVHESDARQIERKAKNEKGVHTKIERIGEAFDSRIRAMRGRAPVSKRFVEFDPTEATYLSYAIAQNILRRIPLEKRRQLDGEQYWELWAEIRQIGMHLAFPPAKKKSNRKRAHRYYGEALKRIRQLTQKIDPNLGSVIEKEVILLVKEAKKQFLIEK